MTRAEFNHAFRSVVCEEFSNVPTSEAEIAHSFSQRFKRRMMKLIESERTIWWNWVNTAGKRVAIIFITLLCAFSVALSVEAVRKPVVEFIIDIFDEFYHIRPEGEITREIADEYIPNYIPDGYKLYEENRSILHIQRKYTDDSGGILIIEQSVTVVNDIHLDNEHGEISRPFVEGKEIVLYKGTDHNGIFATWCEDKYNLLVTSYSDLSEEEILKIVSNFAK